MESRNIKLLGSVREVKATIDSDVFSTRKQLLTLMVSGCELTTEQPSHAKPVGTRHRTILASPSPPIALQGVQSSHSRPYRRRLWIRWSCEMVSCECSGWNSNHILFSS